MQGLKKKLSVILLDAQQDRYKHKYKSTNIKTHILENNAQGKCNHKHITQALAGRTHNEVNFGLT